MSIREEDIKKAFETGSSLTKCVAVGITAYFAYRTISRYSTNISGFFEDVKIELAEKFQKYRNN